MKRVACYVRVSTTEQEKHGISVDSQIDALTEYCKQNEYKIAGIYNDAGISARKSYKNRPALLKLLGDVKDNQIDLIIFTKLDRYFRSVADYYEVQRVLDEYDVKWRCIWEDYETETSAGVFKVNIMLSVAQSEADRASERIKKVFEYKKSKGEVCSGSVGWGYKIEDKKWVKDKNQEPLVNEFFKHYLATFSLRDTQKHMKEQGKVMSMPFVQKMIASPAYYGELPYVTEPYITVEQHEQILKAKKACVKRRKRDYLFTGVGRCGLCGHNMIAHSTPRIASDGTERNSVLYHCGRHERYTYMCEGTSINENVIEKCLLDNIEKDLEEHNNRLRDYYIKNLNTDNKEKIDKLKGRLKRLKDLYELGDIELEEYKEKRNSLTDEISSLENVEPPKEIVLPKNWREMYEKLDNKHKNAFWLRTIDHFEVAEKRAKSVKIVF